MVLEIFVSASYSLVSASHMLRYIQMTMLSNISSPCLPSPNGDHPNSDPSCPFKVRQNGVIFT